MDTETNKSRAVEISRRNLIKSLGFVSTGMLLSGVLTKDVFAADDELSGCRIASKLGRKSVRLVSPSTTNSANVNFVKSCQKATGFRGGIFGTSDLSDSIVRIYHPYQVICQNVSEADEWLLNNGYIESLNHFVDRNGQLAILFNELNSVSEPQYYIGRRTMAYLAFALQKRFSKNGRSDLKVLFPGPSDRLGKVAFDNYFYHYGILNGDKKPFVFKEVFGCEVDPLIKDKKMFDGKGDGVFAGVALNSSSTDEIKKYIDAPVWCYRVEKAGLDRTVVDRQSASWHNYLKGQSLAPFKPTSFSYYINVVA